MTKLLLAALAGVGLVLGSGSQASAWSKFNFGVGLNVNYEGGGNSCLWGLLKGCDNPNVVPPGFGEPTLPPPGDPGHAAVTPPAATPPLAAKAGGPQLSQTQTRTTGAYQPVSYAAQQQQQPKDQSAADEPDEYAPGYWYGR